MACNETEQAKEYKPRAGTDQTELGGAGGVRMTSHESAVYSEAPGVPSYYLTLARKALSCLPASLHSAFIDWVADVSNPDRLRNYELDYRYAVIQFIEWHESQTTQTIKAYREAVEQIDDLVRAVKMVQSEISDLRHRNSNQARIIAADKLRKGLEVALDQFIARDWV